MENQTPAPTGPTITVNIPLTNSHIRILKEFKTAYWGVQYGEGDLANVAADIFNHALAFPEKVAAMMDEFWKIKKKLQIEDSEKLMEELLRHSKLRELGKIREKLKDDGDTFRRN